MVHYLVEAEEAQVTNHAECADSRPGGDLACHLQANLHNLQRVGKDHLGASSLDVCGGELVHTFTLKKKKKITAPASHMYAAVGCSESKN